ncbi:MAG: SAM-dependent methyltransferase [Verrucomicrobia bacterium]|nr:SAM-dependent methyltransferase [Verrucomicrobiota bacterium]
MNPTDLFLANFQASLADGSFRKLTMGKFRAGLEGVKHIYVRVVALKNGTRLNFVRRYSDRDLAQNFLISEGVTLVRNWLGKSSLTATLFTIDQRQQILFNRRGNPRLSVGHAEPVEFQPAHDRKKLHLLRDETFLRHLGLLDACGGVIKGRSDKYRQVHHFIELLAPVIRGLSAEKRLRIVDMGSGKGYLTFAAYAFLKQEGYNAEVLGVERRGELVDLCNGVAGQCEFGGLRFEVGDISRVKLEGADVVIALHACDTATDDAIFRGIAANAQLIILAPCCHKEIRPQLTPPDELTPLFRHGIQVERMAESVTDALRSMYLEASGYSTRIQEFIALEHTKKNLLISASKNAKAVDQNLLFKKAQDFQALFGITHQRLADLLRLERKF